jgi:hypothetical protein
LRLPKANTAYRTPGKINMTQYPFATKPAPAFFGHG